MNNIIEEHKAMVLRLKKPAEKIKQELTPWDCDLIHMGGCLMGEASELYDAIKEREEEDQELLGELGDFEFYLTAVREILGIERDITIPPDEMLKVRYLDGHSLQLMRVSGHFWDVIKRVTVYRKPFDEPDKKFGGKTIRAVGIMQVRNLEIHFYSIIKTLRFTLEQVLQANYTKLADADKGRYASGAYSDKEAQDRRDGAR